MSLHDREKWNTRYAERAAPAEREVPECLRRWVPAAARGRALDIACGAGRNAIFVASCGFAVDALDISAVALAQARGAAAAAGVAVNWIEHDLDAGLPLPGPYQLVMQLHFANAAITRAVPALLAPGGVFVCQQHLRTAEEVAGPRGATHRVAPGELATLLPGLEVLHCVEEIRTDADGQRFAFATLVTRRPLPATPA